MGAGGVREDQAGEMREGDRQREEKYIYKEKNKVRRRESGKDKVTETREHPKKTGGKRKRERQTRSGCGKPEN